MSYTTKPFFLSSGLDHLGINPIFLEMCQINSYWRDSGLSYIKKQVSLAHEKYLDKKEKEFAIKERLKQLCERDHWDRWCITNVVFNYFLVVSPIDDQSMQKATAIHLGRSAHLYERVYNHIYGKLSQFMQGGFNCWVLFWEENSPINFEEETYTETEMHKLLGNTNDLPIESKKELKNLVIKNWEMRCAGLFDFAETEDDNIVYIDFETGQRM